MFDRIAFVFMCLFLGCVFVIEVILNFSFSWYWAAIVLFTFFLGLWTKNGLQKLEVGWEGQLLLLGQRANYFVKEGWHWAPFPFSFKTADCRQTVIKLDKLEKIITQDDIFVEIDGTIIRKIINLHKYFGVEESGIKQGLDDIWDQTIRAEVGTKDSKEVLRMHGNLAETAHGKIGDKASENWGIDILRVVIAGIKTDPKMTEDLELAKREELQTKGQKIENQNFIDRVKEMTEAGLTREQAFEQAQLTLGKASKTIDAKTITLDSTAAELLKAFTGRKS